MPTFAHFYGVRPWEIDLLSAGEIDVLLDWLPKGGG